MYQNVRFAAAPIKEFRFQAPRDPLPHSWKPPNQISCMQVDVHAKCTPGDQTGSTTVCNRPLGDQNEDCLFLDLYVPVSAFNHSQPALPVVTWFYGGAFVFGSKSEFDITRVPLYNGVGPIAAADSSIIFVVPNYRLGAFGWMAGSYLESKNRTNVGLRDQRKALQFVRDHIGLVNGDKSQVSVWGESAGASSILHHLIADFGDSSPDLLFTKAVLLSPAFEWQWDRSGTLNETYSSVAKLAGCPRGDLDCLQGVTTDSLTNANEAYFEQKTKCDGLFPMGPSLDGDLIKELPAVAFRSPQERYHKGLESLIVSHVSEEVAAYGKASGFIPRFIKEKPCEEDLFNRFLEEFIPEDKIASLRTDIRNHYNNDDTKYRQWDGQCNYKYPFHPRADQRKRAAEVIRDAVFTCNTRLLFDAYHLKIPTYMMEYGLFAKEGAAVHASDLLALFWNDKIDVEGLFKECMANIPILTADLTKRFLKVAPAYQSYLTSHAINGDPNTNRHGLAKDQVWLNASVYGEDVINVLRVAGGWPSGYFFDNLYTDDMTKNSTCDFWANLAAEIQKTSDASSAPVFTVQNPSDPAAWQGEL